MAAVSVADGHAVEHLQMMGWLPLGHFSLYLCSQADAVCGQTDTCLVCAAAKDHQLTFSAVHTSAEYLQRVLERCPLHNVLQTTTWQQAYEQAIGFVTHQRSRVLAQLSRLGGQALTPSQIRARAAQGGL